MRNPISSRVGMALMAALLVGAGGCHTTPSRPSTPTLSTSHPDAVTAVDQNTVRRSDIYSLRSLTGAYDVTQGSRPPRQVPFKVELEGDSNWRLSLENLRTVHFTEEGDGALVVASQDELADNITLTYWPPLRLLPATLVPNHPQEFDCQVVIRNRKDGSLRDSGDCHYIVELLGRQRTRTFAGEFNAYMVRSNLQMNLNLASVKISSLDAFVPDRGPVVKRVVEVRRLLGLISFQKTEDASLTR